MRETEMFVATNQIVSDLVVQIKPAQWLDASPATPKWTIRQLVSHLADENRWVEDILAGRHIEDVASQFADDPLEGDEPAVSWQETADSADAAASALADLDRTVHLSFGDVSAREYLQQMIIDHLIHAWDLACALGAREDLPEALVASAWVWFEPQAESWRGAGLLGSAIQPPAGADTQTRLLMLSGRNPR